MSHKVVRRGKSLTTTPEDLTGGTHVYLLARTRDIGDVADLKRRQNLLQFTANSDKPYEAKGFGSDSSDIDFHHFNMG